jgi:hypothetical protein
MMLALILFIIAALGGLTLFTLRLQHRPLPLWLALVHGAFAVSGLIALMVQVINGPAPGTQPRVALGLLVLAAIGGLLAFSFHLRRLPIPIPMLIVHGVVAASGVITLATYVMRI